jgi:hypothetical protein
MTARLKWSRIPSTDIGTSSIEMADMSAADAGKCAWSVSREWLGKRLIVSKPFGLETLACKWP